MFRQADMGFAYKARYYLASEFSYHCILSRGVKRVGAHLHRERRKPDFAQETVSRGLYSERCFYPYV